MKLTIPFKNDLFDRQEFAQSLLDLMANIEVEKEGLVIALDASWGEGKTTFIKKIWQPLLNERQIKSIYFDAFANDYLNEPFLALVSEIRLLIENLPKTHPAKKGELFGKFKKNAVKMGGQLVGTAAKTAIRTVTAGIIEETTFEAAKNFFNEISQNSTEFVTQYFKEKFDSYQQDKDTVDSFKKQFQQLALEIKNESQYPLVVIIDELDRCKPTYSLDLLEKIKHLFSVENVVFVLAMHKRQLEKVVKCVYGSEIEANTYLQKFIHIECRLPKELGENPQSNIYSTYCKYLYESHGLDAGRERDDGLQGMLSLLAHHFNFSLRDLERCYSILTIFYASSGKLLSKFTFLIAFLSTLKVKKPELYVALKEAKQGLKELLGLLDLEKINTRDVSFYIPPLKNWLGFCLLSQEEFDRLNSDTPIHEYSQFFESVFQGHKRRSELVPSICEAMDIGEFSLSKR